MLPNEALMTTPGLLLHLALAIENTDIMLQMVASGRGVTALPRWLVEEYAQKMDIVPLRLGPDGIAKQIHLGYREGDAEVDYLRGFVAMAREGTEHKNKLILTY